jgi:hypothetical protein
VSICFAKSLQPFTKKAFMHSAAELLQSGVNFQKAHQEAVSLRLKVYYGQLRWGRIPSRQKSPPFLVSSMSLSKRRACTVFLSASAQSTLLLFFSVTLFAKGKKDVCTEIYPALKRDRHHRVTLAPEKNNPKLRYITCSYIRALA